MLNIVVLHIPKHHILCTKEDILHLNMCNEAKHLCSLYSSIIFYCSNNPNDSNCDFLDTSDVQKWDVNVKEEIYWNCLKRSNRLKDCKVKYVHG